MLYTQIIHDERKIIDYLFNIQKRSISFIARELNRNKSTISREIKRNSDINGYNHEIANNKYISKQYHKHMMHTLRYPEFNKLFLEFYDKRYYGIEVTWNKIKELYPNIKIPFPNWEDYDFKDKNVFNDDNYKNIPLWFTIIYLSFGKIVKLLENTKEEVFTKIIKNTKLSFDTNLSKKEIVYILTTLKKIRNRICHNNVLFKFWVRN